MYLTTNRLLTSLFVVPLLGAALFSLERVLFADATFILFRIINSDSLQIQEHRFGSFITQGVPLLAARLQLPLATNVVLYSTSFTLSYLVVVLLLLYQFKEHELAVLMGLYFLLFVGDTWFWMNNEVHQGIAWMFLFLCYNKLAGKKEQLLDNQLFCIYHTGNSYFVYTPAYPLPCKLFMVILPQQERLALHPFTNSYILLHFTLDSGC
jgi:hypothetical protein